MPLPLDSIIAATVHAAPVATIYADDEDFEVGDVVLVSEYRRIYWRRITEPARSVLAPSVSPTGWTFLADDHPKAKDSAWILRGVESIEHDTRSTTTIAVPSSSAATDWMLHGALTGGNPYEQREDESETDYIDRIRTL